MAEIELKLALPRKSATKAVTALMRLPGAGKPAEEMLSATYFDTVRCDLAKARMALRLRVEGGMRLQTLKTADGGDGPLSRGEWSDAVKGETPVLGAGTSGRKLAAALKTLGVAPVLVPRFKVDVKRTTVTLTHQGSTIEAAVDVGEIRVLSDSKKSGSGKAGKAALPICELELELKDKTGANGSDASDKANTAALYDLALGLARHLPLSIESRSKAERGYGLIAAPDIAAPDRAAAPGTNGRAAVARSKAVTSPKIDLDPKEHLGEALCRIGRAYLAQFAGNIPAVTEDDVEGVHQMRVSLRRLRGVLFAAKKRLPRMQYDWADQRLKDVLQSLGPARNWDVLRAQLDQVPDPARRRTTGHYKLMEAASTRQRVAHTRAAHAVLSHDATIAYLELARWFEGLARPNAHGPKLDGPMEQVAQELLDRQFKKLRKRGRGFDTLNADERHKLRIACKNMRYSIEVLAALYKRREVKRFLKVLKSAQDGLGALNDTRSAHTLLDGVARREAETRTSAGEVLGWLDHGAQGVARAAAKDIRRLCKAQEFW